MKPETSQYWRRIVTGTVIASAVVLFGFSGATFRTPVNVLLRNYAVALLFSACIGPMLGYAMPHIAPRIWRHVPFPLNWAAITVAMALLAMAGSVVAIGVLIAGGVIPASQFADWFTGSLRISIAVTLTIGLFITAYEVMRARVAQATAEAQLASLESRVQPHFLFNTLNSIAALIHDDPKGAERMTGQLASLLRSSLDQQAGALIAIEDELKVVRDYLAIEQVRFGDRLRYSIEVGDGAGRARVPRMSIQTIVENAVKFAVSARREGAAIAIRAAARPSITPAPGSFSVVVEDDGPGFDATTLPPGHGLALLRDRTSLMFRDRGSVRIESAPGRTQVTLTVPETHDVRFGNDQRSTTRNERPTYDPTTADLRPTNPRLTTNDGLTTNDPATHDNDGLTTNDPATHDNDGLTTNDPATHDERRTDDQRPATYDERLTTND